MYFQVEKQEVHGHPSSVQKEFTVLTNVLPSRKKSSLFLLMYFQVEKKSSLFLLMYFQVEKRVHCSY